MCDISLTLVLYLLLGPVRKDVALLSLKLYGYGGGIFMVFYGIPSILLGYLGSRSVTSPEFWEEMSG
jgi:hypothetical protein